jgi:hypothetical protein
MKKILLIAVFLFAVSVSPALAITGENIVIPKDYELPSLFGVYWFDIVCDSIDNDYFIIIESCIETQTDWWCEPPEVPWKMINSCEDETIFDFSDTDMFGTYHIVELTGIDEPAPTTLAEARESEYYLNESSFTALREGADAEIIAWGSNMLATAKENIYAILSVNLDVLALMIIAIWVIYLAFKFIRKAIASR